MGKCIKLYTWMCAYFHCKIQDTTMYLRFFSNIQITLATNAIDLLILVTIMIIYRNITNIT